MDGGYNDPKFTGSNKDLRKSVGPASPETNEDGFGFTRETPSAPYGPDYDTSKEK